MAVTSRVVEKIQKLLSLANGPGATQDEAQQALLRAQELLVKNGLTMGDVQASDTGKTEKVVDSKENTSGKLLWWKLELGHIVADNFRCRLVWFGDMKKTVKMGFVGLETDSAVALEIYNFAVDYMDRETYKLRKKYRKQGTGTQGVTDSYRRGFLAGLKAKFKTQVSENGWGLMIVTPKAVEERMAKVNKVDTQKQADRKWEDPEIAAVTAQGYRDGYIFGSDRTGTKQIQE